MDSKRTVIVKSDFIKEDTRLNKEIDSLKRGGYFITLLRWDREDRNSQYLQQETDNCHRQILLKLKAPYGVRILPFLPIWWFFVLLQLLKIDCDTIHAINFDSIIPAMIASKIKRKPLIYEMYDTYEDMINLPYLLRKLLMGVDKILMHLADSVIIVDEARIEEFDGITNENVVVIYNSLPDYSENYKVRPKMRQSAKFTIFHAAVLNKERPSNIDKVIAAITELDNVELVLAGFGSEVKDIEKWITRTPEKAHFLGRISHAEVLQRTAESDLLLSLYDPIRLNDKYTSTNKLFQAMMSAKPILASRGTETAAKVERHNCGFAVDCNSVKEIRLAIEKLRDDRELCEQLGANGRRAYEEKYNWTNMEKRLLDLYRTINNQRRLGNG